jgi:hypothetical protein
MGSNWSQTLFENLSISNWFNTNQTPTTDPGTLRETPESPDPVIPESVTGNIPENIVQDQYEELFGSMGPEAQNVDYWTDKLTSGALTIQEVTRGIQTAAGVYDEDLSGLPQGWNPTDYMIQTTETWNREGFEDTEWSLGQVGEYFRERGLSPAQHYLRFGQAEGFYRPISERLRNPVEQGGILRAPVVQQRDDDRMSSKARFKVERQVSF